MPTVNDPNGAPQSVDDKGFAFSRGFSHSAFYHYSVNEGLGFAWYSGRRDIDAADTMLFVKNLSAKKLIFDRLILNGSNVICNWEIVRGTAASTPVGGGGTVTPVNWNGEHAAITADAIAYWDETAIAQASVLFDYWTPVTESRIIELQGLSLGKNHYIQVDQVTESTSGSVILVGHFAD
jgi:hypothetical protein